MLYNTHLLGIVDLIKKMKVWEIFTNIPNFTFKKLEMDNLLEVAVCPFQNFGMFGKHAYTVTTNSFGVHSPVFGHAKKENKKCRSICAG